MDYNAIIQAIGSVGFPIVASIGMFYLYNKTVTELTSTLTRIDKTMDMILTLLRKEAKPHESGLDT